MVVRIQNGAVLLRDQAVATSSGCCCGQCPEGETQCGPECCTPAETCCNGTCCAPDQTCCSGECCNTVCCNGVCCAEGEYCVGGQCAPCPPSSTPCGNDCCDFDAGEFCCTKYDDEWQVISQECCLPERCCNGECCNENEDCVGGVCLERCGDCVEYTFGPVELDYVGGCVRNVFDTISLSVPEGCNWMVVTGSVDDAIEVDGDEYICVAAGAVFISRAVSGTVTLYLVDYLGVSVSADIKICFYIEAPPP